MRRGLAWAAFGLVTLFSGYWAFVNGFQIITALSLGTRIDAPASLWVLSGLYGVHVVVACVAWLFGLRGLAGRRSRPAMLGALVAVLVSWPALPLLYARFSGA